MENVWNIEPKEVFDSIQEDEVLREMVQPEDCVLNEDDEAALSTTTHPVFAYTGFPLVQREILATERAEARQQQEKRVQPAAGHLALAS